MSSPRSRGLRDQLTGATRATRSQYVVSGTLTDPTWANTTVIGSDVASAVTKLEADVAGDLLVHGSAQLSVQGLIAADLVDELRLMLSPVVLGEGKRLFGDFDETLTLKLAGVHQVDDDGVVILTYKR